MLYYSKKKGIIDFRDTGTRRDIGKYSSDQTYGKLGEIAFSKFLKKKFDISTGVDFNLYPGQGAVDKSDIHWVKINGKKIPPPVMIDVKGTKPTSKYFLVAEKEFKTRRYDAYVMVLIDMPQDQLIRIAAPSLIIPEKLREIIPDFGKIKAEIAGFSYRKDIEKKGKKYGAGTDLYDPEKPKRKLFTLKVDNRGFPVPNLRSSDKDWDSLAKKIVSNSKR